MGGSGTSLPLEIITVKIIIMNNNSESICIELSHSRQPPAPAPGFSLAVTTGLFEGRWAMGPPTCFWRSDAAPPPPRIPLPGERAAKLPFRSRSTPPCSSRDPGGLAVPCWPRGARGPGGRVVHPVRPWGPSLRFWLELSFLLPDPDNKWIHDDKTRGKKILFLLGQTIVGF